MDYEQAYEQANKNLRSQGLQEEADAIEEMHQNLKIGNIRGGISAIFARNQSHGLGYKIKKFLSTIKRAKPA